MAKGLIGGMTDYSHQSFKDIVYDLAKEQKNVTDYISAIERELETINANGYWNKQVPPDFAYIVAYSLTHYKTVQEELMEISQEIQTTVGKHHCKRLERLAIVANEINRDIGKIWHSKYGRKEYGNPDFMIVEKIYQYTRDMAVNLLDISNIANRLNDFVGKTKIIMEKNQNLGDLSNTTFGDNNTIIVGNHNQVKSIQIQKGNFNDLARFLKSHNLSDDEISELKNIVDNEKPDMENRKFGSKTNSWISKMVEKCLDGSWAIGIGAAGEILANGIRTYYGW